MTEESAFVDRPDYRVDLLARRNLMTATLAGEVVARSSSTLLVDEQDHGLVVYFPRADVLADLRPAPDRSSVCPFKGTAGYWFVGDGDEPVAWSYDAPYPQVARLAGMIAFYQDRVEVTIGVATPAVVGPHGR